MKTVVIIGNGFDLDLGLHTSYRDFITSDECVKLHGGSKNNLLSMIIDKYHLLNWIDLEEELKQIAIRHDMMNLPRNRDFKADFHNVSRCLQSYLKRVQESIGQDDLRKISCAAMLLKLMCDYPAEFEIYNFNYTDLNVLAKSLGYEGHLHYSHVHGDLQSEIILGFEDDVPELQDFYYMIKTFNSSYSTSHIRESLSKAHEVIIFGHSLGSTDYPYFSEFFASKSSISSKFDNPMRISIITANEDSKLSILKQLRKMNNNRTNILLDRNDVTFFYTNNWTTIPIFHHLLQRLKVEADAKTLFLKWQNNDQLKNLSNDKDKT